MSKTTITARTRSDGTIVRTGPDGSEQVIVVERPASMSDADIEAGALTDEENPPLTRSDLDRMKRVPRTKALRRALGVTQEEFAARYHIPVGTLRDWEQGRTDPDQPTKSYLKAISRDPEGVRRALQGETSISKELLSVPSAIQDALDKIEQSQEPLDVYRVQAAIQEARSKLKNLTQGEQLGAWAEDAAFSFAPGTHSTRPWRTYYGPMFTMVKDGAFLYGPDIANATPAVVAYWATRARTATHPVLKARYADVVWDLGRLVTGRSSE